MENLELSAMLSTDGTVIAIDWNGSAQERQRTILPVAAIPTLIELLVSVASKAKAVPAVGRSKIDRVLQPTDIQIIFPDAGGLPHLRVALGNLALDFALTAAQAHAFGMAAGGAKPPGPKSTLS